MTHYLEIHFSGHGATYLKLSDMQAEAISRLLASAPDVRLEVCSRSGGTFARKPCES